MDVSIVIFDNLGGFSVGFIGYGAIAALALGAIASLGLQTIRGPDCSASVRLPVVELMPLGGAG